MSPPRPIYGKRCKSQLATADIDQESLFWLYTERRLTIYWFLETLLSCDYATVSRLRKYQVPAHRPTSPQEHRPYGALGIVRDKGPSMIRVNHGKHKSILASNFLSHDAISNSTNNPPANDLPISHSNPTIQYRAPTKLAQHGQRRHSRPSATKPQNQRPSPAYPEPSEFADATRRRSLRRRVHRIFTPAPPRWP